MNPYSDDARWIVENVKLLKSAMNTERWIIIIVQKQLHEIKKKMKMKISASSFNSRIWLLAVHRIDIIYWLIHRKQRYRLVCICANVKFLLFFSSSIFLRFSLFFFFFFGLCSFSLLALQFNIQPLKGSWMCIIRLHIVYCITKDTHSNPLCRYSFSF